uniref:Uncharacterized protein n=1 Tax=Rhipicephalus zambeziensis TaxID=60191 RepID=A0A224YFY6_9ACAR
MVGTRVGAHVLRHMDVSGVGLGREEGLLLRRPSLRLYWRRGLGERTAGRALPFARLVDDKHPDQGSPHDADDNHNHHNARGHAFCIRTQGTQGGLGWHHFEEREPPLNAQGVGHLARILARIRCPGVGDDQQLRLGHQEVTLGGHQGHPVLEPGEPGLGAARRQALQHRRVADCHQLASHGTHKCWGLEHSESGVGADHPSSAAGGAGVDARVSRLEAHHEEDDIGGHDVHTALPGGREVVTSVLLP